MRAHTKSCTFATALTLLGLLAVAVPSHAQPRGMMMDEEQREQMMGGYRAGMMGPGYGYGYGYGYGSRGSHMMGSGTMGPGMMMGMGSMMGLYDDLDLTKEQRKQVWQLRRELRDQHMKLMDKMWEETDTLEELYTKDKLDPKEVGKAYDHIFAMQREMIEQSVIFRNKMTDLLNDEQRKKLKDYGSRWWMD